MLEAQTHERQQKIEQLKQQLAVQKQLNDQLNDHLLKEKQRIDEQEIHKQQELSQALTKLQLLNEQLNKSKEEQIAQLTVQIERFKEYPQVGEFRSEA